jgi:hypothetical protein
MVQDIAADRGIECSVFGKRIVRSDHELNLSISGRKRPGLRHFDSMGFAIECNNAACLANGLRQKKRDVADAAADVEHMHPGSDAAFPDQSAGDASEDAGLELQTFDFEVCMTQNVGGRCVHGLLAGRGGRAA